VVWKRKNEKNIDDCLKFEKSLMEKRLKFTQKTPLKIIRFYKYFAL